MNGSARSRVVDHTFGGGGAYLIYMYITVCPGGLQERRYRPRMYVYLRALSIYLTLGLR